LTRISEFGRWRALTDRLKKSNDWFDSIGASIYYDVPVGDAIKVTPGTVATAIDTQEINVSIPMYMFSGIFDTDQLSPQVLTSGLRIELQLEDPNVAFYSPGSYVTQPHSLSYSKRDLGFRHEDISAASGAAGTGLISSDHFTYDGNVTLEYVPATGVTGGPVAAAPTAAALQGTLKPGDVITFKSGALAGQSKTITVVTQGATATLTIDSKFDPPTAIASAAAVSMLFDIAKSRDSKQVDAPLVGTSVLHAENAISTKRMITEYKIEGAKIWCDTHLLNDAAIRQLNATSSQNGLEVTYIQTFNQKTSRTGTRADLVMSRAVSRALTAIGGCYKQRTTPQLDTDYYRLSDGVPTSQQWRLGSQYYPHQPFSDESTQYINALYCSEQMTGKTAPTFTRQDFRDKYPVIMATFEKSSLLNFSGIAINNSRTLSVSCVFGTSGADLELSLWLDHVSVAKAFLNNIIVSI
jgi:hypothetical protein